MKPKTVLAAALTAILLIGPAAAQPAPYPSRSVRMIVPFPAGGSADILARMVGQHLQARLKQTFIVENVGGAGGALGIAMVTRAEPDGYTLGIGGSGALAIAPTLFAGKLPFEIKNVAAVALISDVPNVLVVNPNRVPARSVAELIAYLKANPGKVTFGSSGVGSTQHLAGELFAQMTGTRMVHVPYKGSSPMITDLMGGQIDIAFDNGSLAQTTARSGSILLLGSAARERSTAVPGAPAVAETVPGFEAVSWFGVIAPAGTPRPILDLLSTEIRSFMTYPETIGKMTELGAVAVGSTPDQFAERIASEIEIWRRVIETANIKPQ